MSEVTRLLDEMAAGDPTAGDRLIATVYADLRRMAAQRMGANGDGHTLQPTALVHEAWLRLGGEAVANRAWQSRAHFFGAAAAAMRSILVDRARRRKALRHGGGQARLVLTELEVADAGAACDEQVLAVHQALEKFAVEEPQKAELVKLRYFVGLSVAEAADVMGVSEPTIHRWWAYARAWLGRELRQ